MFTFPKTTTIREIQRNYKKVFEEVKKTKQPIIVMKNNKPDIAIVDVKKLAEMAAIASGDVKYGEYDQSRKIDWDKLWERMKRVRAFKGKGRGNLSQFIAEDRYRH